MDLDIEVSQVIFVGNSADAGDATVIVRLPYQKGTGHVSYGSAIKRSVSFTILFGSAMVAVVLRGRQGARPADDKVLQFAICCRDVHWRVLC